MVEKVIEILKESGIKNTLDIRVTYTHAGVKVHIDFLRHSDKQNKPSATLSRALILALNSYVHNTKYCIKLYNEEILERKYNDTYVEHCAESIKELENLLPYAERALEYVCVHSIVSTIKDKV